MPAWKSNSTRRRSPLRWRRAGALGLILVALGGGCIFQPREAKDPNSISGTVDVRPSTWATRWAT